MLHLLGASRESGVDSKLAKPDEEWNGRVNYLQREMTRIAEEQTALAVDLSRSTENLVNVSESRLRAELSIIENNFRSLKQSLLDEVIGTKETNANVTIAVEELKTLISMAASTSAYRSPVPSEVDVSRTRFVRYDRPDQDA
jgi:predicted  nucleic acid-binding Zn-ribbon protein